MHKRELKKCKSDDFSPGYLTIHPETTNQRNAQKKIREFLKELSPMGLAILDFHVVCFESNNHTLAAINNIYRELCLS